jgi:hypothetical protein
LSAGDLRTAAVTHPAGFDECGDKLDVAFRPQRARATRSEVLTVRGGVDSVLPAIDPAAAQRFVERLSVRQ